MLAIGRIRPSRKGIAAQQRALARIVPAGAEVDQAAEAVGILAGEAKGLGLEGAGRLAPGVVLQGALEGPRIVEGAMHAAKRISHVPGVGRAGEGAQALVAVQIGDLLEAPGFEHLAEGGGVVLGDAHAGVGLCGRRDRCRAPGQNRPGRR